LISIREAFKMIRKDPDPGRRFAAGRLRLAELERASATTPIALGWVTVRPLWAGAAGAAARAVRASPGLGDFLQARVLRDVRVITKALQQRELAEREEASRLVDLRIDFLRALEESVNTIAAALVSWRTGWSGPISCCAATTAGPRAVAPAVLQG
jgi:hypothetical protein